MSLPPKLMVLSKKDMENMRSFPLDAASFEFLRDLALKEAGIKLKENKEGAVYNKLNKRLKELNLSDFEQYCQLLKNNSEEQQKFVNLIANPLTSFFREKHHFQYLEYTLLPKLIESRKKIRIWSAGCSTGEEAYSISITIHKLIPNPEEYDIKILATDINTDSIEFAKRGIYPLDRIDNVGLDVKKMFFYQGTGSNEGLVKLNNRIKSIINFRHLNLIDKWPMENQFDIIFCRNLLIYMVSDQTKSIITKFDNLLANNGHIFLGHTESSFHLPKNYISVGKTIFKKTVIG